MGRHALHPLRKRDRRMSEMDGAILRSLDRLMGQIVQSTWQDLTASLGITGEPLDWSGIHPLGAAELTPFQERPGVFLLFGPLPEVRILHLAHAQGPIREPLAPMLICGQERNGAPVWGSPSNPVPTFAAFISMGEYWALIPALKRRLAQFLAPLHSVLAGRGAEARFS